MDNQDNPETDRITRLERLKDAGEISEQEFKVLSQTQSSALEMNTHLGWKAPTGCGTPDIGRRKMWHKKWFDWALAFAGVIGVVVFLVYRSNSQNEVSTNQDTTGKSGESRETNRDETEPSDSNEVSETVSQRNARLKAEQYLSVIPFSRQGLIDQLVQFEGYPLLDATYGVDALSANWNEQAAKKAEQYLSVMPFSRQGLVEQLVNFEKFTTEQAEYGVDSTGL
jgi:hypothetical protein